MAKKNKAPGQQEPGAGDTQEDAEATGPQGREPGPNTTGAAPQADDATTAATEEGAARQAVETPDTSEPSEGAPDAGDEPDTGAPADKDLAEAGSESEAIGDSAFAEAPAEGQVPEAEPAEPAEDARAGDDLFEDGTAAAPEIAEVTRDAETGAPDGDEKSTQEISPDTTENASEDAGAPEDDADAGTEAAPGPAFSGGSGAQDDVGAAAADAGSEETTAATGAKAAAAAPREVVVERRGGALPMVFGGILAAAIGAGGAFWLFPQGWPGQPGADPLAALRTQVTDQGERLSALADEVANVEAPEAGLDEVEASVADLRQEQTGLSQRMDELASRTDETAAQLDELAARAAEEGGVPDADLAALRDRLEQIETRLASQQEALDRQGSALDAQQDTLDSQQQMLATQRQRIDELQGVAKERQTSAQAALRRAALTRIRTALDTGAAYDDALADYTVAGGKVPEALSASAKSGVPTLAELRANFPDAARAALAEARAATQDESGGMGSVTGFLKSQLGVRSLIPREGNDPDAVLSRAEAALDAGRLGDALKALESLPDVAQSPLSDWRARAEARLAAIAAARTLTAEQG